MKVAISSGHGKHVRGAAGPEPWGLDEVDEAREVVDQVKDILILSGVDCVAFHDDVSTTQSENLERITSWHNSQSPDLNLFVHFNAFEVTDEPMGTECLYVTQEDLASSMADKISQASGLLDRGAKYRSDLYVLNQTEAPAVLIEVCFVDSQPDCRLYDENFQDICQAIADAVVDEPSEVPKERPHWFMTVEGKMSTFGGPSDTGVDEDEGLALIEPSEIDEFPDDLFLSEDEAGAPGLARRLNPDFEPGYIACRWNYDVTDRDYLQDTTVTVMNVDTGVVVRGVIPVDWGPHESTDRVADLSPGLAQRLELATDGVCEVRLKLP